MSNHRRAVDRVRSLQLTNPRDPTMLNLSPTDPMMRDAMTLGHELKLEQLRERYEVLTLGLGFSVCVNIGGIIYFLVQVWRV
jgi:hypothetical protein